MPSKQPVSPADAQTLRYYFAGMPTSRDSSTKDQRFINVIVEEIKNPVQESKKMFVTKRPALAAFSQPPAGTATGRGLYYWTATGKLYSVFANKIYSNTTELSVTLAGSTGRVWFAETPVGFTPGQKLYVSDGTNYYAISTSDVVTTLSTSTDADFPTGNLGPILYFDAYLFSGKSNGQIWNSDVDSDTSWTATNFVNAEMYGDELEAIAKQKDMIIAFGKASMETYFDNETTPGSPLLRVEQNVQQIGLTTKNSLAQTGDVIGFVGATKDEGVAVWIMDGLNKLKIVSTPAIERLLSGETTTLSSCTAFFARSKGHLLYVLNLSTANRTLVYDLSTDFWTEWADTAGSKFNGIASTVSANETYIQGASDGRIYKLSPSVFQDNSVNFTVTLQLDNQDFGINFLKRCPKLEIIGDTTTGNLACSYSDDDYANFSTPVNIDLSTTDKRMHRLGKFRKRAFKFTYTDNYALRLEAVDISLQKGWA